MPQTNAQKQAAHRARRAAKLARYEAALESIQRPFPPKCDWELQALACQEVARHALAGTVDNASR